MGLKTSSDSEIWHIENDIEIIDIDRNCDAMETYLDMRTEK